MNSTIAPSRPRSAGAAAHPGPADDAAPAKHPFLVKLGERVRKLRAERGMTRRGLSEAAAVSERHLANLEHGVGNASVLVLLQVAQALKCPLAELLDTGDAQLRQRTSRSTRVALVGLRGAGKSTLGRMLAEDLGYPFVELSREIERLAGCSTREIHALYGLNAYRRYERRALEEAIQIHSEAVIAAPGGLVSDTVTYNLMRDHCTTVWLQAASEDHLGRVAAQGDLRPMAGNAEALEDLKIILAGRAALYAKAEFRLNTSDAALDSTFLTLRQMVREALGMSE